MPFFRAHKKNDLWHLKHHVRVKRMYKCFACILLILWRKGTAQMCAQMQRNPKKNKIQFNKSSSICQDLTFLNLFAHMPHRMACGAGARAHGIRFRYSFFFLFSSPSLPFGAHIQINFHINHPSIGVLFIYKYTFLIANCALISSTLLFRVTTHTYT